MQKERKTRMNCSNCSGSLIAPVTCYVENNENLIEIGNCSLVISNLNEDDQSSDAQLVRAGVWKNEDCAMLYLTSQEFTVRLAKVNPEEESNLTQGWITEKGEVILKGLDDAIKA